MKTLLLIVSIAIILVFLLVIYGCVVIASRCSREEEEKEMTRQFETNDRYRPIVTIKKVKKDIPTVIEVSGRRYVHDNADTYKGGRKK